MYVFLILLFILLIFIHIRNHLVLNERLRMNDVIFNDRNNDYFHYCSIKGKVSYGAMLFKFWIFPIKKMWPKELIELDNKK